jgi:small ligand-binding sensory domain FIST
LYREVRQAIGVRTNAEAGEHIAKAVKYYTRKLSEHAIGSVILGPYRGNSWSLYGVGNIDGNTIETTLYITTEEMLDEPITTVDRFMANRD